jgi:hypothetical protein
MLADTGNASMARGIMSVLNAVENFCVNTESRKRIAKNAGQPNVKAFANTTGKKVAARFVAAQAFVLMDTNGTGASSVGKANKLNVMSTAISHIKNSEFLIHANNKWGYA